MKIILQADEEHKADVSFLSSLADNYCQTFAIVLHHDQASTSYIQCRLGIDSNCAVILSEKLEEEGIIDSENHMGKAEILRDY
ncbi:DNA segregation ATPase FtsK/SpoIIIE-like protein [Bartonella fuyuanensis]|uniref:DNA segregation ATPase FtsK/SpoIIIE-like protein n=1 Tax=Bartonella fuyuanensis TaxID=1460968 RepID=A0A840E1W8_9HYPH|nr:DNA translocase FtsK [Bartonella fuyuanensis]MBB4075769.1 DNA segregation ATPase FtsK/SpoIIIE-like protein [Bartonella fuyuanensis]